MAMLSPDVSVEYCEVVVVGAGPTGLLLAGELARAVRVTVLDRLAEPSREPKANAVIGQAVRLLHHRGVLARLGHPEDPVGMPAFQFGGLPLDLTATLGSALHSLGVSQQELERALAERAGESGVRARRAEEVVGLSKMEMR